jgi:membrane-associated protease RseP (regulator of RpoE activity)
MNTKAFSLLSAAALMLVGLISTAQNKAQIQIRRNINGVESEETREIILREGEDINSILREMDVLDDFGQLKPGQDIEIRIDKSDTDGREENISLFLAPDQMDAAFPEFGPAPPMENKTYLGVMLREDLNYRPGAVIITEVIKDSPAASCGLQTGDVIVRIDKTEIKDVQTVIDYVQSKDKGDKIAITVLRDGKEKKFKTELGEKEMMRSWAFSVPEIPEVFEIPEIPEFNFRFSPDSITIYCPPSPGCLLPNDSMKICQPFSWNGEGLAVQETAFLGVTPSQEESETGVRINVEEGTSAEKMGLMDGDIIMQINQVDVNSFDELSDRIGSMNPGEIIELSILRNGKQKEISGEIGKRSISGFNDFRIFHDFKGMDEGGNFLYDYEFDMDEKDVEMRMEELLRELDREQDRIDQERQRIESELERLNESRDAMTIKIQISEITEADVENLNNAGSRFETTNTLTPDQISFFPNPGDGILNLTFSLSSKAPVRITLNNSNGEMVYLEERAMFDGEYRNTIDISEEPNGTYFLQITQDGKSYSKKIIKGF